MRLIAYSSSEGGGMNGSFSSTSVSYTNDGRCRVNTDNRPFHNQPIKHVKYYADGLLEKLSEVCERYNVSNWTDLPEQNMFMYDAPTSNVYFTFEDGTKIDLGSRKQYPKQAHELFREIDDLIAESKDYAVDVEVVEEPAMTMGMSMGMSMMAVSDNFVKAPESAEMKWSKFCASCGERFTGDEKFCAHCGTKREKNVISKSQ